jgi:DNA/RNA-binding domain of Phe-tRNA-synthetase-like protein
LHFCHDQAIWRDYPELVPGVLAADGISAGLDVRARLAALTAIADERLAARPESELPEIQAWRRAFARMGLKPTQYRCASESLLRRYRKEGALPPIHPLVDLCNAASLAFAIPIAVFDLAKVAGRLEVRYATGTEVYQSFSGENEQPPKGEVVFADADGNAHARRWTNRQSARSAVSQATARVLIVAEAMHADADADVARLLETLAAELEAVWSARTRAGVLTSTTPRFEL